MADALLRNTVSAGTIQANDFLYHGLNGMNAEVARLVTGAAVNMAGTNRDLGLAIHPYTDAYFHCNEVNENAMDCPKIRTA